MAYNEVKMRIARDRTQYAFEQSDLVWEALQAAGSPVRSIAGRWIREGNKSLAGVGDRIISLVVTMKCRDEGQTIGETNRRIQHAGSNENLARVCDHRGLGAAINGNPSQRGMHSTTTKTATVEALVGAAYLTGGLDDAVAVMKNLGII